MFSSYFNTPDQIKQNYVYLKKNISSLCLICHPQKVEVVQSNKFLKCKK